MDNEHFVFTRKHLDSYVFRKGQKNVSVFFGPDAKWRWNTPEIESSDGLEVCGSVPPNGWSGDRLVVDDYDVVLTAPLPKEKGIPNSSRSAWLRICDTRAYILSKG